MYIILSRPALSRVLAAAVDAAGHVGENVHLTLRAISTYIIFQRRHRLSAPFGPGTVIIIIMIVKRGNVVVYPLSRPSHCTIYIQHRLGSSRVASC